MTLLRWIDLPPVWLLACIAITFGIDHMLPFALFGAAGQTVGVGLVGLGLGLAAVAAGQMMLARTTVIPRGRPARLVSSGVFALSRNPIYLADVMILAGVILWSNVPLAVPLVFAFMGLIQHRFILPEERVLTALFGADYTDWQARTGRWFGRQLR